MAHRTAAATTAAEHVDAPLDLATMRDAAWRLLSESAPPDPDALQTLTLQIRGHIQLLLPEVEAAADRLPADDIPRYCALACLGEARRKLRLEAGPGLSSQLAHARRLARVLNVLVDHHEGLGVRPDS
ncbi:DUF6415 family natural product biosynthesis protein [Streptomyces sp. NPDC002685]|uniref:DUF6415 family natural product biosynthesis protein n=1 Tax=Streptomyces sp. NPDC002685 TaxID=3154540 RepID=UPI003316A13A